MFDLTTYVKKWRIRQLKTVFSTLDTLCPLDRLIFDLLLASGSETSTRFRRRQFSVGSLTVEAL